MGAPIVCFGAEHPSEMLVIGGMHGDEPEAVVAMSAALRMISADDLTCPVVIACNPDGLALGTRANANGVDLNRNFPSRDWTDGGTTYRWSSADPSDTVLGTGDEPASEPETRALIDLIERRSPRFVFSFHAPLGLVEDPGKTELGGWFAEAARLPIEPDVGYPTPGSMGTWLTERGVAVITAELPHVSPDEAIRTYAPVLARLLRGDAA